MNSRVPPESLSPRDRLYELLRLKIGKDLSFQEFCSDFEDTYNLRLDAASVSGQELAAFKALFDVVVWYSPFPPERNQIPNYKSEAEIYAAVERTRNELGITVGA